jgi:hypothetical protein
VKLQEARLIHSGILKILLCVFWITEHIKEQVYTGYILARHLLSLRKWEVYSPVIKKSRVRNLAADQFPDLIVRRMEEFKTTETFPDLERN